MGLVPIICKHYICQLETLRRKSNEVVDILCVWISFYTCANQQKEAPSEALQKRGGELLPHPPSPHHELPPGAAIPPPILLRLGFWYMIQA